MQYSEVVKQLTPCGLDCVRCADFQGGEISKLSAKLMELLGNYSRVAQMKSISMPEFEHYDQFMAILNSFAEASCCGCRLAETLKLVSCPIDCPIRSCSDKGVDFCFQCADYPCEKLSSNNFGVWVRKRNDRMKEIGVTAYCDERLKQSRYP